MKIVYASCGGICIHPATSEMLRLGEQAWLYTASKNITSVPPENYKRAWPFVIACQPFFRLARGRFAEAGFHAMYPVWTAWLRRQKLPDCDVVHSVMGLCTEPFNHAEKVGALKVLEAANGHPTSFHGFWQRELDIWNPGVRVSVPRRSFARCNREIERADVIVCPSLYVRDSMLYNGIPESKLALNHYGVNVKVFRPRPGVPAKLRFLFVGTLTLRKGVQYLLPAFERFKKEFPDAELILCGSLHPDFKKLYARWRHLFTHMHGLTHPQLVEVMHSCTAFVFPSIEEGFALVVKEAMGAALPIIATHNSGASTVVENGKEGFIIPARSSDAVYGKMKELIQMPDRGEAMGKAAAAKVARDGAWSDYGERLRKIYTSFLNAKNGPK